MSSNQGTAGHEWGFVRGMASGQSRPDELSMNPPTTRAPGGFEEPEQVAVFAIGDHYLFTGTFTDDSLLESLAPFYNRHRGRFEVERERFLEIRRRLRGAGYDVSVIDDPDRFAVVVDESAPHPELLFTDSVVSVSVGDRHVFVLPSMDAVDAVVDDHVRPLAKTPVRLSLAAAVDVGPVTVRDVAAP